MVDIPEQIFQSIDLLVDNKINKLSFDRTEEAVVTDASRASEGIYTVSSGTVSYIAYSESRNYRNNDHVYVAIMNNDFTQQKIIISRVFDEVIGNYRDPIKDLTELYSITLKDQEMLANYNPYELEENKNSYSSTVYLFVPGSSWGESLENKEVSKIAISAQFRTYLPDINIISGTFGIKVHFIFSNNEEIVEELTNKDNPSFIDEYHISSFINFSKILFLNFDIKLVKRIKFEVFHDGDFRDAKGNFLPYKDAYEHLLVNNLFIKQPILLFGKNNVNSGISNLGLVADKDDDGNIIAYFYDIATELPPNS